MFYRNVLLAALLALAAPLSANAFSALYVFGDSLSDVGNVQANLGLPVAPYDNGYFSNGPTWVQTLGTNLGVGTTTASSLGGNNYAWGSARTGTDIDTGFGVIIPSLINQAGQYVSDNGGVADADGLYVVWGGGNDVRNNQVANTATDLGTVVSDLYAAGARSFLVPNLPDIGLTPESLNDMAPGGDAATMTAATLAHNAAVWAEMMFLAATLPDITIGLFDVFSLFNDLIANPGNFGFTTVDAPCFTGATGVGGGVPCMNPDDYVFWDGIHPTAAAHALLGDLSTQVVPIPAALPLFLSALGLFGFLRGRKAA